jgi:RimJ/RimL family protein N-acetyltransferase
VTGADISIRPYNAGDAEALYDAARESVEQVFAWLPWCHPGYTLEEAMDWTRARAELFARGVEYDFVITDPDGAFLGACGLNRIHRDHRNANLGYWVRSSMAGRGVCTAAVKQLANLAFRDTDLIRLEILAAVGNRASQRVAEKSGAVREGVLRDRLLLHGEAHDAVVFSITRSTWVERSDSLRQPAP